MRFFFQRRPKAKHGSFLLTSKGERRVEQHIGTDQDTLVLFAFMHGSQTDASLPRSLNLSRKEVENAIDRLVRTGHLTNIPQDESGRGRL